MRNGRPKAAVLFLLLALFILTGSPGTPAQNTGSSSSAAAVTITAVANTAVAYTSPTNTTTAPTTGNATTSVIETTNVPASTIVRNLTIGYLTAARGKLDNRQGLAISGALTLALKEASIYCYKNIHLLKSHLQHAAAILLDVSLQNNKL
ncbi:hypothetical protein QTP88_002857 [Uroleucon formosanum]